MSENNISMSELRSYFEKYINIKDVSQKDLSYLLNINIENNAVRKESSEEAVSLDDLITEAWKNHPHFETIDNSTNFEQKMNRLLSRVLTFLENKENSKTPNFQL